MSAPGFGGQGYTTQESRALSSIGEAPGPDLSQGQEAQLRMLQSHDYQIKFLAQQVKLANQAASEANQNPVQQIEKFIANFIVLLGGGELAEGALDFGDLQYILPALGALFGFGDTPFPISLFTAAEKLFLGYIVPTQQFTDVINRIIEAWLGVFGIDKKFVKDVEALVTAIGDLFDGIGNLFPSLNELFGALGITSAQLGPLGQLLKPILDLFTGFDLTKFGSMVEFITDAIDPWIVLLTKIIDWVDSVLAVFGFGGSVVNSPLGDSTLPFGNLASLFGGLNFANLHFDPADAWATIVNTIINPIMGFISGIPVFGQIINQVIDMITSAIGRFLGFSQSGGTSLSGGGSLVNTVVNTLFRPGFDGAGSIAGGGKWFADPTVTFNGQASAKVVADGTVQKVASNSVSVTAGQQINVSVNVQWAGLTGSGTPIQLGVLTNLGETILTQAAFAVSGSFAANRLSVSYVVPVGVTRVATLFKLDATATAGAVWWATPSTGVAAVPEVLQGVIQSSGSYDMLSDVFLGGSATPGVTTMPVARERGNQLRDYIADSSGSTESSLATHAIEVRQTMDFLGGSYTAAQTARVAAVGAFAQSTNAGVAQANQVAGVLSGAVVTPINSTVAGVITWYNAH